MSEISLNRLYVYQFNALYYKNLVIILFRNNNYIVENNYLYET